MRSFANWRLMFPCLCFALGVTVCEAAADIVAKLAAQATKITSADTADGYQAGDLILSDGRSLRFMAGTRPYFASVLPSARDLYRAFADGILRQSTHIDDQASGVDRQKMRARDPLVINVSDQEVAFGEFVYTPEATEARRLWAITLMVQGYPLYFSLRSELEVTEDLVKTLLSQLDIPWKED